MSEHQEIWAAVDRLADQNGLSPSGLARRAGLDPTTFNKSKRFAKDGRPRWPSTESISKILVATGTNFEQFFQFVGSAAKANRAAKTSETVPLLGFAQAGVGGFFDDGGYPAGHGWDEVELPTLANQGDYALRISGDSMRPVYRDGDIIVVSTTSEPVPGDRIVARLTNGEVMAKVLLRRDERSVSLMSFNTDHPTRKISNTEIEWMARITWASQ